MLILKKRYYPFSWLLGNLLILSIFYEEYQSLSYTSQMIVLLLKSHYEGFRLNIFFYALSLLLDVCRLKILSLVAIILYFYLTHKLNNYHLPDGGSPVGHLHLKGGILNDYKHIPEMAIYYPASIEDCKKRKKGFKWLKVKDYAKKMDDTAKKDVRRKRRVPYLFFKIVVSQFYKFMINVYENAQIDINFAETSTNLAKFSVIVLSHGLASHCDGYSVVARYLAQQGHIVFVPEHIENIRNIYLTNEENREYRKVQLLDRINTVKQVLDIIYNEKLFSELFKHPDKKIQPDFDQISIIGHSFGGSTAYAIAQTEKRITGACILYDPCLYIFDFEEKVKLHIPLMSINADDFYRRLYSFMENDERLEKAFQLIDGPISDHCANIYIKDQQHADFSDIPIIWNGESGLYSISKNVHEVHLRFGMILLLTKIFLEESKQYHKIKHNKQMINGNEELKSIILKEVERSFGAQRLKLLRWKAVQNE
ncbi:unnamed protein product [Paramecium octaurelia]|uniref:1-alkyl-2-acetylglycerophosphocholine esterase n=1 Tax=Paramecium octaurelia TaxID=43137 RepID=A0A8S1V5U3_PAROT|nr:unnamed protein product [Paramecium octaurelia]